MSGDDCKHDTRNTHTWLRVESIAIAAFFFFTFIVGPYRRWQNNPAVRFLLTAAAAAAGNLFTQVIGILLSYDDKAQLYLVWIVFLCVAHETAVAAKAYSIYDLRAERIAFEITIITNNAYVAVLMGLFSFEKFLGPLWGLWGFTVAKMLQRVIGFRAAARTYGPENVDLVAHLMSPEHEMDMPTIDAPAVDDAAYKYNYLIRGEDKLEYEYDGSTSSLTMKDKNHKEKVVTVDRVWNCKGRLLYDEEDKKCVATRLKDVCLSFALFKLLRRRFRDYPAEDEGQRNKARKLVLEKLLKEGEKNAAKDVLLRHCNRTFRVIQAELEFLHDLFYTKYPISFHRGISVLNILQLLVIASSLWTAVWVFQEYYSHSSSTSWGKIHIDLVLTYVFTALVIAMELWEFNMHLLSNWSKVLTTCNYVRHHRSRDMFFMDKLVAVLGLCGTLWKPLSKKMGQYSLFEAYTSHPIHSSLSKATTCVFGEAEVGSGAKQSAPAMVTRDVQYAIFQALRDGGCCISDGETSLRRNEVYQLLPEAACKDDSFDRKILVWHIATSYFELEMAEKGYKHKKKTKKSNSNVQVAICLSRYCAYLLLFVPHMLPVNNLVAKLMFENVIWIEAKKFFGDDITWCDKLLCRDLKKMYKKMKQVVDPSQVEDAANSSTLEHSNADKLAPQDITIMDKGLNLAKQLKCCVPDEQTRWTVLAEFWAEFILFLAPSDNAGAHLEKLSNGGEFITHLWVLLYNAGIRDRPASVV